MRSLHLHSSNIFNSFVDKVASWKIIAPSFFSYSCWKTGLLNSLLWSLCHGCWNIFKWLTSKFSAHNLFPQCAVSKFSMWHISIFIFVPVLPNFRILQYLKNVLFIPLAVNPHGRFSFLPQKKKKNQVGSKQVIFLLASDPNLRFPSLVLLLWTPSHWL